MNRSIFKKIIKYIFILFLTSFISIFLLLYSEASLICMIKIIESASFKGFQIVPIGGGATAFANLTCPGFDYTNPANLVKLTELQYNQHKSYFSSNIGKWKFKLVKIVSPYGTEELINYFNHIFLQIFIEGYAWQINYPLTTNIPIGFNGVEFQATDENGNIFIQYICDNGYISYRNKNVTEVKIFSPKTFRNIEFIRFILNKKILELNTVFNNMLT